MTVIGVKRIPDYRSWPSIEIEIIPNYVDNPELKKVIIPNHNFMNDSCRYCSNHPLNGGSGICNCVLGIPKIN